MSDTCVPNLIVICTAINQLETKVSLKNNLLPEAICCCLQTCNVAASEEIVYQVLLSSIVQLTR